jgi:hypothetical protein
MKDRTSEDLVKSYNIMQRPGGWDFDPDARYTRAYFQYEILEELNKRQVKYEFDEEGKIKI